jgi:hypothetical protein
LAYPIKPKVAVIAAKVFNLNLFITNLIRN